MLSEMQSQKMYDVTYMESKNITHREKHAETHTGEQRSGYQCGEGAREKQR